MNIQFSIAALQFTDKNHNTYMDCFLNTFRRGQLKVTVSRKIHGSLNRSCTLDGPSRFRQHRGAAGQNYWGIWIQRQESSIVHIHRRSHPTRTTCM